MTHEDALVDAMRRAMGPDLRNLFDLGGVEDIMVNPDGQVFYIRAGRDHEAGFQVPVADRDALLSIVAHWAGVELHERSKTIVSARLPQGYRFEGSIPPTSPDGPQFTIRLPASAVFTMDHLESQGTITPAQRAHLRRALSAGETIVFIGPTGSGKSRAMEALLTEPEAHHVRVLTVEDTLELRLPLVRNKVAFQIKAASAEQVMNSTLRNRPTRIVFGEARDGEAFWRFLKAVFNGHGGGITSMHSDDPRDFMDRCEMLIGEVLDRPENQRPILLRTMENIVHIAEVGGGKRRVLGIYRPVAWTQNEGWQIGKIGLDNTGSFR